MSDGRASTDLVLLASSAITATGAGSSVDITTRTPTTSLRPRNAVTVTVSVSAATGADRALRVFVQHSKDGSLWVDLAAFDAISDPGIFQLTRTGVYPYVRTRYTLAGTSPSFTVEASAVAVICYASILDLYALGVRQRALDGVDASHAAQVLIAASDMADTLSANADRPLPLVSWGYDLRQAVSKLAAFDVLCARGFDVNAQDAGMWQTRYEQAIGYLKALSTRAAFSASTVDADDSDETIDCGVSTASDTARGW